jgi:hypothetical protein
MKLIIVLLAGLLCATTAFAADSDRTAYLKEHIKALQLESQLLKSNTDNRQAELQKDYAATVKELQPILDAEKKAAEEKKKEKAK